MSEFFVFGAVFIALTVGAGWLRALRGPTLADRIMAVQLIGSGSIAVLLLMLGAADTPGISDVALTLAMLSALLAAAFARTSSSHPDGPTDVPTGDQQGGQA
jgi:multicomponent Na+:H+ antiporter subunit F